MSAKESQCRQNFHATSEAGINQQINLELYACYSYQAMAVHFDRDDVALPKVAAFFRHSAEEEQGHAQQFMDYQNKRGGRVALQPIEKPAKTEFTSTLDAVETALGLERRVNEVRVVCPIL